MALVQVGKADKYQRFFDFMNQEHDLVLTIEEMDEIIRESQVFVKEYNKLNQLKQ